VRQVIVDDIPLALQATRDGVGIANLLEDYVRTDLDGRLVRAGGLVPAVSELSPQLSQPPPATAGDAAAGGGSPSEG